MDNSTSDAIQCERCTVLVHITIIWVQATEADSGKFTKVQGPVRTKRTSNVDIKAVVKGTWPRKTCFC